ncbi:MAG: hypothetical protein EPO68_11385 [Planctomycetota bacterium]|nr:MAG: hypothetical protein EPO68_11385 [Planctomycetota bacterium]
MRALAVGVVVVLVAGLAAFFVLRAPAPTERELGAAAHSAADDAARPAADAALAAGDSSAAPLAVRTDAAPVDRAAIAELPTVEATLSGPTEELFIVDAATRAPIADARVRFADIPAAEYRAWFDWNAGLGPGCRRVEAEGRALRSDESGRVRIPVPAGRGVVVAQSGDRFGIWWYDADAPRPWTLALERDAEWIVHARDVAGRPIPNLPLEVRAPAAPPRAPVTIATLETDANGEARVEHAAWLLAHRDESRFAIHPLGLFGELPRIDLDGRAPPTAPSELVLPEVGLVRVHVLDPDGAPLPTGDPSSSQQNVWLRDASVQGELKPGPLVARVPLRGSGPHTLYVRTGLELEAIHRVSGVGGASTARASGPRAPFDTVDIAVRAGSGSPLVRVRVLDERGPFAQRRVGISRRLRRPNGSSSSGGQQLLTDARGILIVPLEELPANSVTLLTLTDAENEHRQALVRLDQPVENGWVDAGDALLAEAPLLVAGLVCDGTGAPLSGARVDVQGALKPEYAPPADPKPSATPQQLEHQRLVRFMMGPRWDATSDAAGRFEVRAFPICSELKLSAQRADQPRSAEVECAIGADDVRLVLASGGTLAGRVLLPDSLQPEHVRLSIEPLRERAIKDSRDSAAAQLAADGTWSASGLLAGRWQIKVQDARVFAWEPLVPPIEVDVVADTTTRAPDIDLRALMRTLSISVVDERGAPIAEAQGTFRGADASDNNDIDVRDGKATIHTRHASIDAWIGAPGRRCVHVPELADGARIVLPPAASIELRLRDLAALPPDGYELRVQLDPGLGADNWMLGEISRSSPGVFDRAGATRVTVPHGGRLRVNASVRVAGGLENARMEWVAQAAPAFELALDGAPPEHVELDIDPAAVRAAVEKLRAR